MLEHEPPRVAPAQAVDDLAGAFAFVDDIAGAANEDADGLHAERGLRIHWKASSVSSPSDWPESNRLGRVPIVTLTLQIQGLPPIITSGLRYYSRMRVREVPLFW